LFGDGGRRQIPQLRKRKMTTGEADIAGIAKNQFQVFMESLAFNFSLILKD